MFVPRSISFVVLFAAAAISQSLVAQETRVLKFPADRSMGSLQVGPTLDTPEKEVRNRGGFTRLTDAQGDVTVPSDRMIRLDVSLDACSDLSPLADLPSDALHVLSFNSKSPITGQLQHIRHLTSLRQLKLRSCAVKDDDFRHLAKLANLESLHCSVYGFADQGFGITDKSMDVIKEFSKLRVLLLRDNPITDAGLAPLSLCDSLEVLSLDGTKVTGKGMDNLFLLPNLKTLSFGVYDKGAPVDDEGMEVLGQMPNLENLDLTGTLITDEGMKHLASLSNLRSLTLDHTAITDEGLEHLAGLKKLTRLRFYKEGNGGLGDVAAANLSEIQSLEKITASWTLTSEGIDSIARLVNLKSFDFGDGIVDENLASIANMTSLEDIGIQNCKVSDAGLTNLQALKNLERVLIHGTKATPACLTTFVKLPKLKHLHMSLEQSGDAPFVWPTEDWKKLSQLSQLETIRIDGLLLDKRHWSQLAELRNLKRLEIRNLVPVGEAFFQSISNLKALESLEVQEVSASGVVALGELSKLPNLQSLDIRGPIDDGALEKLSTIPTLRRLQMSTSLKLSAEGVARFKRASKSLQGFNHGKQNTSRIEISKDGIIVHRDPRSHVALDAMLGNQAPKLSVDGLPSGKELDVSSYSGKVVLIHFWSAYSIGREPRPDEVHVRDVVAKFADRNLKVIGVHSTRGSERMKPFMEEQGIDWSSFVDSDNQTAAAWHIGQRGNRIYLLDGDGKVRIAQVYQGDLENALELVLREDAEKKLLDKK